MSKKALNHLDKMSGLSQVYAKHLGARISPKKVAPVADLVRGMGLYDAKVTLTFDPTKASKILLKVLKSAEANAKHNNKMTGSLKVSEVWVGPGQTMKRGRPDSRSRFSPILKRTSNIYVGLVTAEVPATPAVTKKKQIKKETKNGSKN